MGIYTPTEVLLKVYLKRIMEANSIDPGTFTIRAKTGLDASRHPWFRWREGLNPKKDTPYQNITVMGMFINQYLSPPTHSLPLPNRGLSSFLLANLHIVVQMLFCRRSSFKPFGKRLCSKNTLV